MSSFAPMPALGWLFVAWKRRVHLVVVLTLLVGLCSSGALGGSAADAANAESTQYIGSASRPDRTGYWLVTARGEVRQFGSAGFFGDLRSTGLNQPIVGMATTASGNGYWLVAGDGGIFTFGDARFFGSTGSLRLNKPVVAMAATPSGNGYWMVASDGGIFTFGDARFFGSTGSLKLQKPIVAVAAAPGGAGYVMVASDGGVFNFGSSRYWGSMGGKALNQPMVGIAVTASGNGYWLVAADGGVFTFGDAAFLGSTASAAGTRVVAVSPTVGGGYNVVTQLGASTTFEPPVVSSPPSTTGPTPTPTTRPPSSTTTTRPPVVLPTPSTTITTAVPAFQLGVTKPNASNTGVPAGTGLTVYNGDMVITAAGTVVNAMDVRGIIKIRAANVTIKNSIVRGGTTAPTSNTAMIDCNDAAVSNALIERVTLVPQTPNLWVNGVIGHDYTARRVNVYNTVDGFGVYNNTGSKVWANVTIEGSYVHGQTWYAVDPNHSNGPTHNDGIQVQGGGNITIVGNYIDGMLSTTGGDQNYPQPQSGNGILVQNNVSPIFDSHINSNWIDGSTVAQLFFKTVVGKPLMSFGEVRNNRFGRNQYDWGNGSKYTIRVETRSLLQTSNPLTDNYWENNGVGLTEGRNTGIRYDG